MSKSVDLTKAIDRWAKKAETEVDRGTDRARSALEMIDEDRRRVAVEQQVGWARLAHERVNTIYRMLKDFKYDSRWLKSMRRDLMDLNQLIETAHQKNRFRD